MNLDSLNKWLMLAANIGVITGIIFLAIEVDQNNLSTKGQTRAMPSSQVKDLVDMYMRDDVIQI